MPSFCFGPDSCAGHMASAQSAGIPVQVLQRSGFGVDVDEASDLKCIMERLHLHASSSTAQLLYNTELGARVTLALATLSDDAIVGDEMSRGIAS
jgi:2-phospho-L-lactate guanylyltransferase (CobY/MobA/RfbA family)